MKKTLCSIVTAILFLLPTGVLADTDNYIISVKDGEHISAAFEKKYNLTQLTTKDHGLYITDEKNAEKLENNPKIEDVSETHNLYLMAEANDPGYQNGQQWGIDAVNATYGWTLPKGKTSTVVVIDTGFDFSHEDRGDIQPGKDFVADNDKDTDHDYFTHGTACAGLIGAKTNNGIGIAGLTDQCRVVVYSVFESTSNGEIFAEDADVIAAIYSAIDDYHADVISMSFGGRSVNSKMEDAVRYAYDHNAILVAAAGNRGTSGSPYEFPAAYDEVIGVGNMDRPYNIEATSTRNESVYVSAPGTGIYTLSNQSHTGKSYAQMTGTSLATPYVAALAALAKAQDPSITPEEFKYYLRTTSVDLLHPGYDIASGYGLINYQAFFEALQGDKAHKLNGAGTAQNPYQINNEQDLRQFCLEVSKGNTTAAATVNADIAISNPSGITVPYNGVFNGNGHRISGLTDSLFDTIETNGVIQNLTLQGNIHNEMTGGLFTTINQGSIVNCHAEGQITSEIAGGICGVNCGSIRCCSNRADVICMRPAGIAAVTDGGTITQCYNHGQIRSSSNQAAGICGYLQNGASMNSCYNTGIITGSNSTGGIVYSVYKASLSNCYYDKDSVKGGISTEEIYAKSADYMKTKGFVCMLNRGNAAFTMDSANINGGYPIPGVSDLTTYFTDINNSLWYADPIYELAADKILQGRGNNLFVPEDTVTRAEFVTILAQTAKVDLTTQKIDVPFRDVTPESWYAAAVSWAYKERLAYGKSEDQFSPNDSVTREEIASFLVRYIHHYSSKELPSTKELTFQDTDQISPWAKDDTALLTTIGVINGFPDGTFRPQHSATRGQAAQMTKMMRNGL